MESAADVRDAGPMICSVEIGFSFTAIEYSLYAFEALRRQLHQHYGWQFQEADLRSVLPL